MSSKSNIWFTGDEHLGHANIIEFCKRSFDTVGEMDSGIVKSHNDVVDKDDLVYHHGDFTLGGFDVFESYAAMLNGTHYFLPGSHDHRWWGQFIDRFPDGYAHCGEAKVFLLSPIHTVVLQPQEIDNISEFVSPPYSLDLVLCHYAMRVWPKSHFGSWHLYAHSHGRLPGEGYSFDAGWDNWRRPISLEEVIEVMLSKKAAGIRNTNQL